MKRLLLALSFLCFTADVRSDFFSNGDFQIWNRYEFHTPFHPQWTFTSQFEWRYGDDASKLFLMYAQGQISYKPVSWLTITPTYRQTWLLQTTNTWLPEYYPFLETTLSFPIGKWRIENRNRLVYRTLRTEPSSHWIERNRIRIVGPWHYTVLKLTPFVENEIFIMQRYGFNEDRASAGLFMPFYKHVEVDLYYMRRFQKLLIVGWVRYNILNIALNISF